MLRASEVCSFLQWKSFSKGDFHDVPNHRQFVTFPALCYLLHMDQQRHKSHALDFIVPSLLAFGKMLSFNTSLYPPEIFQ